MNVSQVSAATVAHPASSPPASAPVSGDPGEAGRYVGLGHQLSQAGRFVEAEAYIRKAIELNPRHPMAHNNLGWIRQMQGDDEGAVAAYRKALQFNADLRIARRNLAVHLVRLGRRDECLYLWRHEMLAGPEGLAWLDGLAATAMQARDLTLSGEYAAILTELRWSSQWYPPRRDRSAPPFPVRRPALFLTVPKLRHDIEQFIYLQSRGVLGDEFTPIIKNYESTIDRLTSSGIDTRVPLDDAAQRSIGHVYNRIVHVRHAPRLTQALSGTWSTAAVESQYLDNPPGVVVVDDFLSSEALESVRLFCLESTVWSANRYAHGRLGAFFRDGFNCPLLLQIAEELRDKLPRVIGQRYPLRQLWGFKNGYNLPGDSTTHADFAAVNVNFWITPDDANLDETSGGLVVYGVDAPSHWDFDMYNSRPDVIKPFLRQQQARAITIPYRQNRAIIFNSDLFHATAELKFKPGYENRRVNVTMLYGDRENDVHHLDLARPGAAGAPNARPTGWRSAAFGRVGRSSR